MKSLELLRNRTAGNRVGATLVAPASSSDRTLQGMLRQHGIALRCRSAELAHALQRFRDRQAQIDAGMVCGWIEMPAVDAGWLPDAGATN